jgi:hypothetical protein
MMLRAIKILYILFPEKKVTSETIAGVDVTLYLGMVLKFATGADAVPAQGFDDHPQIMFNHDPKSKYPTVNTCANITHISVMPQNMDNVGFRKSFTTAILESPGFGNI